ncbi:unnamed protein product, partial [Ectocarpus sp. 6 AP-2014]
LEVGVGNDRASWCWGHDPNADLPTNRKNDSLFFSFAQHEEGMGMNVNALFSCSRALPTAASARPRRAEAAAAAAAAVDARPEDGPMGRDGGRMRSAQIVVFDVLLMVVVLKGV